MNWRVSVLILLYAALVAAAVVIAPYFWLHSVWFLDDSYALRLSDSEWFQISALRACISVIGGAVVGAVAFALIRTFNPMLNKLSFRRELLLSSFAGAVPVTAGIAGAVEFFLARPYV
jgi:hypothetical protein